MTRLTPLLLITCLPMAALGQEERITADNWLHHPEIEKVREIYRAIEAAIESGLYTRDSEMVSCNGQVFEQALYRDSAGSVIKYAIKGSTGDTDSEAYYYYESPVRLRFVFQSIVTWDGSHVELRTYIDERGLLALWDDERVLDGSPYEPRFTRRVTNPFAGYASPCELVTVQSHPFPPEAVQLADSLGCAFVSSYATGLLTADDAKSCVFWCGSGDPNKGSRLAVWISEDADASAWECAPRVLSWPRPTGTLKVREVSDLPLHYLIAYKNALDGPEGVTYTGRAIVSSGLSWATIFVCHDGEWYLDHAH